MARSPSDRAFRALVPPPQHRLEDAAAAALARVQAQPAAQLEWLGARPAGPACAAEGRDAAGRPTKADWVLPVLDDRLALDLGPGAVTTSAGRPVSVWWRVLVLHYLSAAGRPEDAEPALTFADLPGGRAYDAVYRPRVIGRLVRTAGRDREVLRRACLTLGGRERSCGDLAFDFAPFPRVPLRLVWHAGDDELPPSASLLLPPTVEDFLSIEDIVVMSELLVARLGGGTP